MSPRRAFVLVAGAAVGLAVWLVLLNVDADALAARARAAGPLGPLALFLLLVVQCVVAPVPSEPIMMATGFVYGPRTGFVLGWAGVVVGAIVSFALARRLGRPFAERFVRPERLDAIDAYVAERGVGKTFGAVLALRLFAFGSFDVLSYACGLVAFPFRWFVVATVLGAVPKVFAFTYAGASVGGRPGWVDALILGGTFGVLVAAPWLVRWWRARGAAPPAGPA